MRSIWKGAISFGLVTIPVKLYSATEQRDVAFHQVHREDGGRMKYKRVCSRCGEEVPYSDIAKGYELPDGEMVVLTDEDFANLPLSSSRRIDVLLFVPMEQVDPIYFSKSYYLEPDAQGTKPYVLLRDALENSGTVAIVKVALRQRESLATLRVRDGVFVIETMLWPDEVRAPEFKFLEEDVEVRPQELRMASSLIETMAGDFDPSEYKDAYREALQEMIEAKIEGREVVAAGARRRRRRRRPICSARCGPASRRPRRAVPAEEPRSPAARRRRPERLRRDSGGRRRRAARRSHGPSRRAARERQPDRRTIPGLSSCGTRREK